MRRYVVFAASIVISAGFGFWLGRTYPMHRYQQFGQSRYLFDSAKGRLCDPAVSIGNAAVRQKVQQPEQQSGDNQNQEDIFTRRAQILKDSEALPSCGKE